MKKMIRNSLNLYTRKTISEAIFFHVFWLLVVYVFTSIVGFIFAMSEILNENNFYFLAKAVPTFIITLMILKMYRNKSFSEPILPIILFFGSISITYIGGYLFGVAIVSITTILKLK